MVIHRKWLIGVVLVVGCAFLSLGIGRPLPAQSAPAQPTPAQPTPVQSAPAQPAPAQPTPAQSTPTRPARYQDVPCTGAVRCVLVDTETGQCWERVVHSV